MIDLIVRVFQTDYPTPNCKLLALAIARRCGNERGLCWASQATLSADTGMARSTVQDSLKKMEHKSCGLLVRYKRGATKNGARLTDIMSLQFPEQTLEAVRPDLDAGKIHDGQLDLLDLLDGEFENVSEDQGPLSGHGDENPDPTVGPSHDRQSGLPMTDSRALRDQIKNPEEESTAPTKAEAAPWPIDEDGNCNFAVAAEALLWHSVETSRDRSSLDEVEAALPALWKATKSRDEQPADWYRRIEKAVQLYMASPTANNEGGRYATGLHRLLSQEKFVGHWCDRAAKEVRSLGNVPRIGTTEQPTTEGQVLWMKSYIKAGYWPESQGPAPDEPGCRVSADILKSFGFGPQSIRRVARRRLSQYWRSGVWRSNWGPEPTSDACWIPKDMARELHLELLESGEISDDAPVSDEGASQTESDQAAYDPADDAAAFD